MARRSVKKFHCRHCGAPFDTAGEVKGHKRREHPELYQKSRNPQPGGNDGNTDPRTQPGGRGNTTEQPNAGDRTAVPNAISYAFGHCQTWIHIYAAVAEIPEAVLARGVAELLLQSAGRPLLGA